MSLKSKRRQAGLTTRALAAKVGVSAMAISKYERGLMTPSSTVLIALSQVLGTSVGALAAPISVRLSHVEYCNAGRRQRRILQRLPI
jgi:transcriptional regulator with XRE-family HTH domain